jgi:hypothetical protein
MNDGTETLLMSIDKNLDSIDTILRDQFSSVDGVGYATQQAWMRLVEVRDSVATIGATASLTLVAAAAATIAVIAHVIHHW